VTDFAVIALVALLASGLTLYSGFGLGTLLLPAFALFLPAPAAVAATATVHLLNNIFKGGLVGQEAHWPTLLRFGLPAIPAAILGAYALGRLSTLPAFRWTFLGYSFEPSAAGVVIGCLMIAFAILELQPWFQRLSAPPRLMSVGGALTGFLGGLTGQQGALRSMFLLKSGLAPERFIATGVLIAIMIDISRLPTYVATFATGAFALSPHELQLVAAGTMSAFVGAWLGARFLKKATLGVVRLIVATLMLFIGAGLIAGVIGAG
jgi:uncharacterized membrane protein YfcA